jgi:DnaJ-class molecular chaperone
VTPAEADESPEAASRDQACPPCRGTGQVISHPGGEPKQVTCPWCEGSGRFIPGHDAQALGGGETAG